MTSELYDTIQLGIAALAIATPVSIWLHGRMKYGSSDNKERIEKIKRNGSIEIARINTAAEIEKTNAPHYVAHQKADSEALEQRIRLGNEALQRPEVREYLQKREKLARELMTEKTRLGFRRYDSEELEAQLNAVLGRSPLKDLE